MFKDEVTAVGNAAKGKLNLLENNFAGYVLMSILAGMYIALGSIYRGRCIFDEACMRNRLFCRPLLCNNGWRRAFHRK